MKYYLTVIALCLPLAAFAQTAGSITGEVRDPSNAFVASASITVTNSATNAERSTTTNTSGIYSFPDLTPGVYSVKAVSPGFDVVVKTNVELQVQQTARIDFTLTVGQNYPDHRGRRPMRPCSARTTPPSAP